MSGATFIEFTVSIGERPLTLNKERTKHWSTRSKATAAWKEAAAEQLMVHKFAKLRFEQATFWFRPLYPQGNLPDTGSIFPVEKAIVDACVDAGIIPDDNAWHNHGQISEAPRYDRQLTAPEVYVALQEFPAHAEHGPRDECRCRATFEKQLVAKYLAR